nr:unnamed protein product [Spirometra erinaceieuropaei]
MVSFDVASLLTSVPQQLLIDFMNQLLAQRYEERDKALKSEHLLEFLRHCLKTYFTFGGQMYEQIEDTPLGSSLPGLAVEVVLQRIELLVFPKYQPELWAHYVDDIEHPKETLNSVDPDTHFAMETEANNQLPFLDMLVRRCTTGQLQIPVFLKSTDTERSYTSTTIILCLERACVCTLFQRVEKHCSRAEDKRAERNIHHMHPTATVLTPAALVIRV